MKFRRELRDKENKDIYVDRNYIQLKNLRESYALKKNEDPDYKLPPRIAHLTYLTFLTSYKRW